MCPPPCPPLPASYASANSYNLQQSVKNSLTKTTNPLITNRKVIYSVCSACDAINISSVGSRGSHTCFLEHLSGAVHCVWYIVLSIYLCQRCQLVRFMCKPYGFLRFARAYWCTMQSLPIFMIFADSNLQSFHALYSNCCQFAVTPSMLHEH